MSPDCTYQETIDYLYALQKQGVKLALANSEALMNIMGDPHLKFRSVHIAGTNGKGSTAAFIASMLAAAGYRVGLYTSPHLVSFTERIRIDGRQIAEAKVVELAQRVRRGYHGSERSTKLNPTFFEVTTAIAFSYFAEESVDIAVVEVGMGGRLDSTNVITPLVSVITNIDLEHTEFLGTTLEQIAEEKAGIIKPQVPVVTGATQPEVLQVIQKRADEAKSKVYRMGRDFKSENLVSGGRQRFDYCGIGESFGAIAISLLGRYQVENACLATAAIECLRKAGVTAKERHIRQGLERACWEGRLERVAQRPDVYLDGAHNPASARMLAGAVTELKTNYRKLTLVIGILGDKDFRGILSELVPLADRVIVTRPQYSRAMDLAALASEVRALHPAADTAETVADAIEKAKEKAASEDLILITGSLYVVGDACAAMFGDSTRSQALSGLKG